MPKKVQDNYVDRSVPVGKRQDPTNPDGELWDELAAPFERQPLEEEGVPVGKSDNQLTDVQWIRKGRGKTKAGSYHDFSIAKTGFSFTSAATKKINAERVILGTGIMNGQHVLLIKPAEKDDSSAYTLSIYKHSQNCRIANPGTVKRVLAAGLSVGKYKMRKVKGGFIGLPIKEGK